MAQEAVLVVLLLFPLLAVSAPPGSANSKSQYPQPPYYGNAYGGDDYAGQHESNLHRRHPSSSNRRHSSDRQQVYRHQRQHDPHEPSEDRMMFPDQRLCVEMCEVDCMPYYYYAMPGKSTREQQRMWNCDKLMPPPRPLHEKFVEKAMNASPFEYVILGIVFLAIFLCCVCACYQCCCRSSFSRAERSHTFGAEHNNNNNVGATKLGGGVPGTLSMSTGMSAEQEALTNGNGGHIDGVIHPAMVRNGGAPSQFGRQQQHVGGTII